MCKFFVAADPILYESRTRSIRIHGVLTSIRVENFVWETLACLAEEETLTTNALIVQFHDEILRRREEVENFSSFLRVTCMRYLRRKCDALMQVSQSHDLLNSPVSAPVPRLTH